MVNKMEATVLKEHRKLHQKQVSKVTLHFVWGHLTRKQTVSNKPNLSSHLRDFGQDPSEPSAISPLSNIIGLLELRLNIILHVEDIRTF